MQRIGGRGKVRLSMLTALLIALTVGLLPASPANALSKGDHKTSAAFQVDQPVYLGWDAAKGAYKLSVTTRWLKACGNQYCWPASEGAIGSPDAVELQCNNFSCDVKYIRITTLDACGNVTSQPERPVVNGDVRGPTIEVRDVVSVGMQTNRITQGGKTTTSTTGNCGNASMPGQRLRGPRRRWGVL